MHPLIGFAHGPASRDRALADELATDLARIVAYSPTVRKVTRGATDWVIFYPTMMVIRRVGPWTPLIKTFSMSAVRLGPVMQVRALPGSLAPYFF